ncbi:hypothetical protein NPX13_g8340 [Xylaria arbuscula]|uniref:Nephrocystin 3-like N-terminal domain-containing protein n=1 Tax=Xylaria arbuscula TaxID=114810 RepID=A0A9W8N951_9PEZI|nr:hypothetical protein NPX13_g8340 [Xylaria arbuscula]
MALFDEQFNPDVVFEEARDEFIASLALPEKAAFARCESAEELLKQMSKMPAFAENPHGFKRLAFFVSSHAEFAAIAWGAIRLMLKLASNFGIFFDKLTDTLEKIGLALPTYRFLLNILQSKYGMPPSKSSRQGRLQQSIALSFRIKRSICVLYQDILRFFLVVVRVFAKVDGSPKSSVRVGLGLLWKPYDLRFKDFLGQLVAHRTLLESEIQCLALSQAEEIEEVLARQEVASAAERVRSRLVETATAEHLCATEQTSYATLKALKFTGLKAWLNAPQYAESLERALDIREPGTADWIFSEQTFTEWLNHNTGNPGCGKTVVASSVVEFLKNYSISSCACYFFFRAGGRDSERSVNALSSILAQTLKHHRNNEGLIDKFLFAMDEAGSGQPTASENELWDLLRICTTGGFIDHIVLDAIDECVQGENLISRLFEALGSIPDPFPSHSREENTAAPTQVALFSRPHITYLSESLPDTQLAIKHRASRDIDVFLTRSVQSMRSRKLLPATLDVSQTVSRLATRAMRRLREMDRIVKPEKLDDMYDRIIELILLQNPEARKFVQWMLMWLVSSKRELSEGELYETLKTMDDPDYDLSDLIEYEDFSNAIVTMCSSLVERVDSHIPKDDATADSEIRVSYRLIHLSAKEYLESFSSDRIRQLMGSEEQLHLTISRSCLLYLTKYMPRNTASSENSKIPLLTERAQRVSPLYAYATEFWVAHLPTCLFNLDRERAGSLEENGRVRGLYSSFLSIGSQFLFGRQSLLSFIEGFYMLVQNTSERERLVDDLGGWARRSLDQLPLTSSGGTNANSTYDGFLHLAYYLRELEKDWGSTLSVTPGLVWDEVLSHNPCPLIPATSSGAVHTLSPTVDDQLRDLLSSKCLLKISEVTSDRQFLAVLSIWPSREYDSLLENRGDDAYSSQKLRNSCSGWAALFELYDISSSPSRVLEQWLPLDDDEVWIQHCHSLSDQHVQFPVSRSPCGYKFSILRDVFAVVAGKKSGVTRTRLFVTCDKCANELWSHSYAGGVNARTKRRWDVSNYLYHYWIEFDQDGGMLFFTDRTARNHGHRHLAVFRLSVSQGIEISLVSSPKAYNYLEAEPITASRHCFHPQRSLVAFTVAGSALIWDYSDTDGINELALYPFHTASEGGDRRLWLIHQSLTEGIRFSECGDHIILEYYESKDAIREARSCSSRFLKVPKYILGKYDNDDIGEQQSDKWSNITVGESSASSSEGRPLSLSLLSNNTARSADALVDTHGNVSSVSVNANHGAVTLSLSDRNQDGACQVDVELTRLPDSWQGLDKTNVIFQVPKAHQDRIQMAFNKSLNLRYSMSGDPDPYFPAVVERSIDSLGRSVLVNTNTAFATIDDR